MPEVVVQDTPVPLLTGSDRAAFYTQVLVSLSGGDLRVRTDGHKPSTSSGVQLYNGGTYSYPKGLAMQGWMVAAVAGVPVTVFVEGR